MNINSNIMLSDSKEIIYQLYMPNEEKLKQIIETDRQQFEIENE
jgi:hypothetical protein